VLNLVSLARRPPRAEDLNLAVQKGVPKAKWLHPHLSWAGTRRNDSGQCNPRWQRCCPRHWIQSPEQRLPRENSHPSPPRDSIKQPGPQSGRESMFSRVQTCTPPFLAQRIKLSFASESYASTIPFYMRDLNTWGFNTLRGPGPMHSTETHIHRDVRVCVCVYQLLHMYQILKFFQDIVFLFEGSPCQDP